MQDVKEVTFRPKRDSFTLVSSNQVDKSFSKAGLGLSVVVLPISL